MSVDASIEMDIIKNMQENKMTVEDNRLSFEFIKARAENFKQIKMKLVL